MLWHIYMTLKDPVWSYFYLWHYFKDPVYIRRVYDRYVSEGLFALASMTLFLPGRDPGSCRASADLCCLVGVPAWGWWRLWPSRSGLCPASVGPTNLNKEGQTLEMYMFVCERVRGRMRPQCVVRFRQTH